MAKNMQPVAKRCKALGISPAAMGYAKKTTERGAGNMMRKKKSEYALQLQEKQKVKFVYGIMEKQFRMYYEKAARSQGKTGEELLVLIGRHWPTASASPPPAGRPGSWSATPTSPSTARRSTSPPISSSPAM